VHPPKRQFHIGDVLSITGGRLVSRDGYTGLQRALSHMAGEEIYTHQIGRVMDEAGPVILEKYPLLAGIVTPKEIDESTVDAWLIEQASIYGEFLTLPRMTIEQHERIDPLSEVVEKKHPDHVRTIIAPPRSSRQA
jgi:hypothetical protein